MLNLRWRDKRTPNKFLRQLNPAGRAGSRLVDRHATADFSAVLRPAGAGLLFLLCKSTFFRTLRRFDPALDSGRRVRPAINRGGLVRNKGRFLVMIEAYERLKQLVEACSEDVAKAAGGNKAAGTRVRKAMQEIKAAAQEVRIKVLEDRSQSPAG